jgi:integration host factor subunit beta
MSTVRSQIEKQLADRWPNLLRKDINKIIEIILSEISNSLYKNDPVEIRGFGRFSTKNQKSRLGRNPKSGEKINIPQKRALKWKCSKILLKKLNKNFTENKISATN